MADLYYHPDKDFFTKRNLPPPTASVHGTEDDLTTNLKRLMPNSWHLEGNMLVGMTEMGRLVQRIPPEYICTGTDSKGLPKLQRVVL